MPPKNFKNEKPLTLEEKARLSGNTHLLRKVDESYEQACAGIKAKAAAKAAASQPKALSKVQQAASNLNGKLPSNLKLPDLAIEHMNKNKKGSVQMTQLKTGIQPKGKTQFVKNAVTVNHITVNNTTINNNNYGFNFGDGSTMVKGSVTGIGSVSAFKVL